MGGRQANNVYKRTGLTTQQSTLRTPSTRAQTRGLRLGQIFHSTNADDRTTFHKLNTQWLIFISPFEWVSRPLGNELAEIAYESVGGGGGVAFFTSSSPTSHNLHSLHLRSTLTVLNSVIWITTCFSIEITTTHFSLRCSHVRHTSVSYPHNIFT